MTEEGRDTFAEAVAYVTEDYRGREFLWWLLSVAGVHHSCYGVDAHATAFNAGRQDVGHRVLDAVLQIENGTGAYARVLKEGQDRERDRAERDRQRDDDAGDGSGAGIE